MYDLGWTEHEYPVLHEKAGKRFPMHIVISKISSKEMMEFEREFAQRPFKVERDGGTTTDLTGTTDPTVELFDKHFVRLSDEFAKNLSREECLGKLPAVVKRAVILNCIGGLQVKSQQAEMKSFDDLIGNSVTITDDVNGEIHSLTHSLRDWSEEDEIAYRRATTGKLRTLAGHRDRKMVTVTDYTIFDKMYDKLILSVSGYVNGDQMVVIPPDTREDRDARKFVLASIPYMHKKVVVQSIFGNAEVDSGE